MDAQVRYDACHRRKWSDLYLVFHDEIAVGYGAVKGIERLEDRDAIFGVLHQPPATDNTRNSTSGPSWRLRARLGWNAKPTTPSCPP